MKSSSKLNDRDVIWFVLNSTQNTIKSNFLGEIDSSVDQQLLEVVNDNNSIVILIDKDGSSKYRSRNLVLQDIFNQIDSMRIREMRK